MKYVNRIVYFLILISLITFQPDVQAKGEISGKGKTQVNKVLGTPQATWFTINNVATILRNDGMSDLNGQDSGFEYPKGANKTVFYESGFVYGGNFNGEFRIGGSTYNHSQVPGRILDDGTAESADLEHVRIYRVRRDYKSPDADFSAEINKTGGTAASVYTQYEADWNAWPAQYGAPYEDVDGNGSYNPAVDVPGVPGADQTIWFVANDLDPTAQQQFYGTLGLGCEMQATFWGYNTTGALGNAMFRKYTLINKSGVDITDMYVCMWSDPDLGDAGDDYTGCDIDLSLGYIYNGDDNDASYGVNVPAGGFDFFQGPIVPSEGSQAVFNGQYLQDYRNLPMSAFFFFINGDPVYQDPTLGDPTGAIEFRNLMEGKISTTGVPFVDPTTGLETKFTLSGNPVTGTGWIDGIIHRPGDRRLGMVAGPFTMAAGDVQEVVVGQFVAGGSDGISRLGAIGLLKFYDLELQLAYDNFFQVPPSVKAPIATATALDQQVVINWGTRPDIYTQTESYDTLGFQFQGYVVYQLPSASSTIESAKRVATFDKVDLVQNIESQVFDTETNSITRKFVKFGTNAGVQRSITIDKDLIRSNVPIVNGTEYYFGVTAYAFNANPDAVPNVLETPLSVLSVTPQAPNPGYTYNGEPDQKLTVTHSAGTSDGIVTPVVVDPTLLTGANYSVTFAKEGKVKSWNVLKNGQAVLTGQTRFGTDNEFPIVDGIRVGVQDAPAMIKGPGEADAMVEVAYGGTVLPSSKYDAAGAPYLGNKVWHSLNSSGGDRYYVSAGNNGQIASLYRYVDYAAPRDFEFRFTAEGGYGVYAFEDDKICKTPFEIWDIGIGTPDDPSDDKRMIPFVISNVATSDTWGWATGEDPYFGYPQSDWVYWMDAKDQTAGDVGYKQFENTCVQSGGAGAQYNYAFDTDPSAGDYNADFHGGFVYPIGRWVVCDFDGDGLPPPAGTTIRIIYNKPLNTDDVYKFTAPSVDYSAEKAKQDVNMINAFPNPYYGVNPREVNKYQKYITFSHLPQKATLRIFNLAGQLIRTIVKDDSSPFTTWSLSNEADLPVASGLYIVHIDMPELGTTKILKVAIVQEQQILDRF